MSVRTSHRTGWRQDKRERVKHLASPPAQFILEPPAGFYVSRKLAMPEDEYYDLRAKILGTIPARQRASFSPWSLAGAVLLEHGLIEQAKRRSPVLAATPDSEIIAKLDENLPPVAKGTTRAPILGAVVRGRNRPRLDIKLRSEEIGRESRIMAKVIRDFDREELDYFAPLQYHRQPSVNLVRFGELVLSAGEIRELEEITASALPARAILEPADVYTVEPIAHQNGAAGRT